MRESPIEKYLVQRVEGEGGEAEKFKSPQRANVPDRLCTYPLGLLDFVELKATGKWRENSARHRAQRRDHARRRAAGFKVFVLDSREAVDWYMDVGRHLNYEQYMALVVDLREWCL